MAGFFSNNAVALVSIALMLVLFGGGSFVLGSMTPHTAAISSQAVQATDTSASSTGAAPADTVTTSAPTVTTQAAAAAPQTKTQQAAPEQPRTHRSVISERENDDD